MPYGRKNGESITYPSDSYHTSKSKIQLHGKPSEEETRKSDCVSGENAVGPCRQDYGNGGESVSSSVHDKSHIFHPEREHQELLFRGITSWRDGKYERRETIEIPNYQTSIEKESTKDEDSIFECRNHEKNERLRKFLGPLCGSDSLEGSSWVEKACYFVLPDNRSKWRNNSSMSSLSDNNEFDTSCNNPSLVTEIILNESDRIRIATFLGIKIQSEDLQINRIRSYLMEIAYCGFNHIIIIGKTYCGLLFLDCYERVFRWDSQNGILVFMGDFFKEKPCEILWGVLEDGTVWELESGNYTYFALFFI